MKILEKITYKIILIVIVVLNICIGSNIKEPIWIIQMFVSVLTIIYVIVRKIKNKNESIIIKGKVDIVVLLFMIATTLPLLFKTYVSQEGCINFILKYWSIYGFYILIRNEVDSKEKINGIVKTLIISSLIPILFGYDKFFKLNIFEPFLDFINAVKIEDTRMISTFGYANTFAAYLGVTTALAIGEFLNVDKIYKKVLYGIYIVISSITILLTQSKFVLALIALIIFIFIIKGIKDKKISKRWIIGGIIFIIMFFVYFFIAINISKPLEIGEEKNCVIRGIEKNTKYNLEFDIEGITDKEYNVFEINVVEITRYLSEKTIGSISFSNFSGTKQINVEADENTDHIEIRFKNPLEQEFIINDFRINGEKYILEYKIIPDALVRIFTTFNFKNSSVWQRADYWMDGLDIIKDNWLIGAGGNAWRMLYGQNQDYLYYAKESHSYILEVWMSFGLLGIISYLFIIAIIIKSGIELINKNKENKKEYKMYLSILIGMSIIIIHSIMDFDMSYLIIKMIFYMFLAIINKDEKNIKLKKQFIDYIIIFMFLIVAVGNSLGFISSLVEDETGLKSNKIAPWVSRYKYNKIVYLENNNLQSEDKINYIKEFIKEEPYLYQNIMYEIMGNTIIEIMNNNNIDKELKNIEFLKESFKNIKIERRYDISAIQRRADIIMDISEKLLDKSKELDNDKLKEEAYDLLDILVVEYDENSKAFLEYDKNQEGKTISNMRYQSYTASYEKAKRMLNNN